MEAHSPGNRCRPPSKKRLENDAETVKQWVSMPPDFILVRVGRLKADRQKFGPNEDRSGGRPAVKLEARAPASGSQTPSGGRREPRHRSTVQGAPLGLRERFLGLRRRHDRSGIGQADPVDDETLGSLPRENSRGPRIAPGKGPVAGVEAESGLARRAVDAVAGRAMLGEDRLDLPFEVGSRFRRGACPSDGGEEKQARGNDTEATHGG